ncbi:hypothetical protein Vadar_014538 [Vaccinium darrowii]|uniref:Uncharacterized protein n=1 Tax=Vaccinium darrowii TaxID=229202 RepID=A0ACB7YVG3_9ERIC|nr:hypothetical protein Vadar_014538 [Vaccinium darrowii]
MTITATPVVKDGCLMVRGKVVLTGVPPHVVISPASGGSAFIGASLKSLSSYHVCSHGVLEDYKFMCLFIAKIWWMIPRLGKSGSEIPMETQMLLLEIKDESLPSDETSFEDNTGNTFYVLLLPALDGPFRTSLQGTSSNELQFCTESGDPNVQTSQVFEAVFMNSGDNPFELIKDSINMCWLARILEKHKGTFSHVENKKIPAHLDWFGWCTWDAFYTEVNPKGIKEGLQSWLLGRTPSSSENLKKYNPKTAYPVQSQGNLGNIRDIAMDYLEKFGVGIIDPEKVYDFYSDLHSYLASSSVDGVKVDVQNLMETLGSGLGGRVSITRQYQQALDESISKNFKENNLIACLCHNSDSIYSSKKSATARASKDFMPNEPTFQTLHIASVASNSLLLGEIVVPDWDMFHSNHSTADFHGAARAIGGCAVYVSDKPGKHDFKILKKLVLPDGSILKAKYARRPTRDCFFQDPVMDGRSLLKIWNMNKLSGVVGVFNCQGARSWPMKQISKAKDKGKRKDKLRKLISTGEKDTKRSATKYDIKRRKGNGNALTFQRSKLSNQVITCFAPSFISIKTDGHEKAEADKLVQSEIRQMFDIPILTIILPISRALNARADTLLAFNTKKDNPSGLTSKADPNRKALYGQSAIEIKKAASPMCKSGRRQRNRGIIGLLLSIVLLTRNVLPINSLHRLLNSVFQMENTPNHEGSTAPSGIVYTNNELAKGGKNCPMTCLGNGTHSVKQKISKSQKHRRNNTMYM